MTEIPLPDLEHIHNAVQSQLPGVTLTKWCVVAEFMHHDGTRELAVLPSEGAAPWDVDGMMSYVMKGKR